MLRWFKCVALALIVAGGTAFAASESIDPPTAWPQTDVPTDPSVTFGTLPNGMRYVIRHNDIPAHGVSVRLRIATGSLHEMQREQGIAHFLEHMAFRGSKHVADPIKMLQSIGVGFGNDSNAYTSADATTYIFDFPANDNDTLDKALTLTRDIASELKIDSKAVDAERAVVLAEYKLRDTPNWHMSKAATALALGQTLAAAAQPIGTPETVGSASADDIRKFYRRNYRPERAVLMIAGDIDVKATEADIRRRFADWRSATPKPAAPVYPFPDPADKPVFKAFSEPGITPIIQLMWVSPLERSPETAARDERDAIRDIALSVLNQRFQKLANSADPPFLAAGASHGPSQGAATFSIIGASIGTGDPLRALRAMHDTYSAVLRDGVTQAEVDQIVTQHRTSFATSIVSSKSRTSSKWVSLFVSAVAVGDVINTPEDGLLHFENAVKGLTAARVTEVLKELFAGRAPIVFLATPAPLAGGEDALKTAFEAAPSAVAAKDTAVSATTWPYTDFGKPGTLAGEPKKVDDLDVTFVNFANGVRATIKPTKFSAGQVSVAVRFGHGRFGLPTDRKVPRWAVAGSLTGGGLKRIASADLPKVLAGKQWGAQMDLGESAFVLRGHTRTADVETELQLLLACIAEPAWRPEGLQQTKSSLVSSLNQTVALPDGVYSLHHWEVPHNGDVRWAAPTADEIEAAKLDDVKAIVKDALKDGPIEVVIVGDITVEDAVKYLKATFATLPKRKIDTAPPAGNEQMPKAGATPFVFRYQGPGEQAVAAIAWRTTGMYPDVQATRVLTVLERVMWQRLFDELRVRAGMTYTVQSRTANSIATPGWGLISMASTIPAAKISDFYAAAAKVAADLKAQPISAEEFERARGPLVNDVEHSKQSNEYWMASLPGAQVDPRLLDLIRTDVSGLKQVKLDDIQIAAMAYLADDRVFKMLVVPQNYEVPATLP